MRGKPMNRRLRIIETNYGRNCGWYVEVEGRKIARLSDPEFVDMFWDSYRLEPLTDDPKTRRMLYTPSSGIPAKLFIGIASSTMWFQRLVGRCVKQRFWIMVGSQ